MRRLLQNSRGNIPIAIVFAALVAVMAIYVAVSPTIQSPQQLAITANVEANLVAYKDNLAAFLANPVSWQQTYQAAQNNANGVSLSRCVTDPTYTCPSGSFPLYINNATGTNELDPTNNQNGFDLYGTFCTTYGTANQGTCQFQYLATWSPNCPPTGTCTMPPILIKLKLNANPSSDSLMRINSNNSQYQYQTEIY